MRNSPLPATNSRASLTTSSPTTLKPIRPLTAQPGGWHRLPHGCQLPPCSGCHTSKPPHACYPCHSQASYRLRSPYAAARPRHARLAAAVPPACSHPKAQKPRGTSTRPACGQGSEAQGHLHGPRLQPGLRSPWAAALAAACPGPVAAAAAGPPCPPPAATRPSWPCCSPPRSRRWP